MNYPWAVPGAKVVCIDPSTGWTGRANGLVQGRVYTIERVVEPGANWTINKDKPGIHLVGVASTNPNGFKASRFRPVVSQDDDIAMFREIADRGLAQNGIHVPSSPELVP